MCSYVLGIGYFIGCSAKNNQWASGGKPATTNQISHTVNNIRVPRLLWCVHCMSSNETVSPSSEHYIAIEFSVQIPFKTSQNRSATAKFMYRESRATIWIVTNASNH